MHSHGYPEIPDPTFTGGTVHISLPSSIDQSSPQFERALEKCREIDSCRPALQQLKRMRALLVERRGSWPAPVEEASPTYDRRRHLLERQQSRNRAQSVVVVPGRS